MDFTFDGVIPPYHMDNVEWRIKDSYIIATICSMCGKKGYGIKMCARCVRAAKYDNKSASMPPFVASYCSKHCQKRHWKVHKLVCSSLQKLT